MNYEHVYFTEPDMHLSHYMNFVVWCRVYGPGGDVNSIERHAQLCILFKLNISGDFDLLMYVYNLHINMLRG